MAEKPVLILPPKLFKEFQELPEDHPLKKQWACVNVIEDKPITVK